MDKIEEEFRLRFHLEIDISEEALDDDDFDENAWKLEWERGLKPQVIRAVFDALRGTPLWSSHIRNRGIATDDEVEIVVRRSY